VRRYLKGTKRIFPTCVHQQIRNQLKKEREKERKKSTGKKIKVLREKNEENPRKERKMGKE
jgi:hypothetical protein